MATSRGFIRSYSAAVNRAERAEQRRAREAAKQYKQQSKAQEFENAAQAVKEYEEYIEVLKSVHKHATDLVDWTEIKNEDPPSEPRLTKHYENEARKKLENYTPSFIDKTFRLKKKKILKLEKQISEAIIKDKTGFENRLKEYQKNKKEWEALQKISSGVLNNEPSSYKEAIEYFNPFSEIKELGSRLTMNFEKEYVVVDLHVNNDDIIPKYILSLTSTGKLSRKNMPTSKFNELYQDYVCSCILRLGRETLAYLPVKFALINALSEMLNTATGKVEEQPILSVSIYPETLEKINFDTVDPSDSMKNFVHTMKFSKAGGFSPVEKLSPMALAK
jgi:hypothetical protein